MKELTKISPLFPRPGQFTEVPPQFDLRAYRWSEPKIPYFDLDKITMVNIGGEKMAIFCVTYVTRDAVCAHVLYKDFTLMEFVLFTDFFPKMGIEKRSLKKGSLILMGEDGMVIGTTGPRKGYIRHSDGQRGAFSFTENKWFHPTWPKIIFSSGLDAGKSVVKLTKLPADHPYRLIGHLELTFDTVTSPSDELKTSYYIQEKALAGFGLSYEKLPDQAELVVDVFGFFEDHPYGVES